MDKEPVIQFLKEEMQPAMGVTEPAAIALAASTAYRAVGGDLIRIKVVADPGVFKNGFSCGIPGTDEKGNEIAAILGVLAGEPDSGLNVLKNLTAEHLREAVDLRTKNVAAIEYQQGLHEIFIDARVTTTNGTGRAVIQERHTNIVLVEANGIVQEIAPKSKNRTQKNGSFSLADFKLNDFIKFVNTVTFDEISFTIEAVEVNRELARAGSKGSGMGTGPALSELLQDMQLGDNMLTHAQILTGHAIDARMSGIAKPAMSICGSGNHGIISTLPVALIAEKKEIDNDRLARALALSYLITIYIKAFSGRLSAFCGCAAAAGTGASAGIVFLLDGTSGQIEYAINNMAANLTGMICDGGNYGCSLKAMTSVNAAIMSALFALKNVSIPVDSGIVGHDATETMQNMGRIANPGMVETDNTILDIMVERHKKL